MKWFFVSEQCHSAKKKEIKIKFTKSLCKSLDIVLEK